MRYLNIGKYYYVSEKSEEHAESFKLAARFIKYGKFKEKMFAGEVWPELDKYSYAVPIKEIRKDDIVRIVNKEGEVESNKKYLVTSVRGKDYPWAVLDRGGKGKILPLDHITKEPEGINDYEVKVHCYIAAKSKKSAKKKIAKLIKSKKWDVVKEVDLL